MEMPGNYVINVRKGMSRKNYPQPMTEEEKKQAQREACLRYYHKNKEKICARRRGLYSPEKRHVQYEQDRAAGKTQEVYKKKMEEDPLFNRKVYIKRKAEREDYNVERGRHNKVIMWQRIVEYIRESELASDELAIELNEKYHIGYSSSYKPFKTTEKRVYRPRIRNTTLTDEEIQGLVNSALASNLTCEQEVIKTVVSYVGEMLNIEDKREEKEVDIYTAQTKEEAEEAGDNNRIYGRKDKRG